MLPTGSCVQGRGANYVWKLKVTDNWATHVCVWCEVAPTCALNGTEAMHCVYGPIREAQEASGLSQLTSKSLRETESLT